MPRGAKRRREDGVRPDPLSGADVALAEMLAGMGRGTPGASLERVLATYTAGNSPILVPYHADTGADAGICVEPDSGLFSYRPHPFLGALYREVTLALRACAPCVAHVTGPRGCGKSHVLAALVAMLREMHAAEYAGTRAHYGSDGECHAAVRQIVPAVIYVSNATSLRATLTLPILKSVLAQAYAGDVSACANIANLASFASVASYVDAQPTGSVVVVVDGAHEGLFRNGPCIELRLAARHFAYVAVTERTGMALLASRAPDRVCIQFTSLLKDLLNDGAAKRMSTYGLPSVELPPTPHMPNDPSDDDQAVSGIEDSQRHAL